MAGGAVGVLVGFFASEIIAAWRRRSGRKTVRVAVQAEIRQNQISIGRIAQQLISNDLPIQAFAQLARPWTSTAVWTAHLTSPDAFTSGEVTDILGFYEALLTIDSIWQQVQRAAGFDVERDNLRSAQHDVHGALPFSGGPGHTRVMQSATALWPQLRGAIEFVEQFRPSW